MTGARFVVAGDECVDHSQSCELADPERGDRATDADAAVRRGRVFERSNHGRPDGNDASVALPHGVDRRRRPRGNLIRLGQREHRIETRVASRGNSRGVRQRGERRAARPNPVDESPVKKKACGWSFEGDRAAGDRRPGVPHRQRIGEIRVLDRAPMPCQPFPNFLSRTVEPDFDQPRMFQDCPYDRTQRPERQ